MKKNKVEPKCECVVKNRLPDESQREWFKRWMCMYHWMETDYYRNKLHAKNCPTYGNYQPPYEECNCEAEK
jgi:hypothetical protein